MTTEAGNERGLDHAHGHRHGRGHGHTHGAVDPALLSTAQGISAVKWSLVILGATAAKLKALIARDVPVKVCGTCMVRCGIHKNEPYFDGAESSTQPELAQWVIESDKVLAF